MRWALFHNPVMETLSPGTRGQTRTSAFPDITMDRPAKARRLEILSQDELDGAGWPESDSRRLAIHLTMVDSSQ